MSVWHYKGLVERSTNGEIVAELVRLRAENALLEREVSNLLWQLDFFKADYKCLLAENESLRKQVTYIVERVIGELNSGREKE